MFPVFPLGAKSESLLSGTQSSQFRAPKQVSGGSIVAEKISGGLCRMANSFLFPLVDRTAPRFSGQLDFGCGAAGGRLFSLSPMLFLAVRSLPETVFTVVKNGGQTADEEEVSPFSSADFFRLPSCSTKTNRCVAQLQSCRVRSFFSNSLKFDFEDGEIPRSRKLLPQRSDRGGKGPGTDRSVGVLASD